MSIKINRLEQGHNSNRIQKQQTGGFGFLRHMYTMLPVSLDCPFLISPSVLSSVYLEQYKLI